MLTAQMVIEKDHPQNAAD